MKKLSFIDKLIYAINSLMAFFLLFSYITPYVSPQSIPIFSIVSLFVPFLLIVNILFFLYWLLKLKKQLFTSFIVLAIGWFCSTPFYKLTSKNNALNNDLKIMSYNVRAFNHRKWIDEKNTIGKIKNFLFEQNPDILIIQENISYPKYLLDFKYSFIKNTYKKGHLGSAIYSNFPIINKGNINFKNSANEITFVDILKKTDTIRVYNFHLQSLQISPDKENFGEKDSKKLIKNLEQKFTQQAAQTELFLKHQKKWKGKKIICGDFNNTAYSWVYKQLIRNKKDAFLEAGEGFGRTFRYWFPMRIDFILVDGSINVHQFKNFSVEYSDHFPILARVNW